MQWFVGYGGKLSNGFFTRKEFPSSHKKDINLFISKFNNRDVYRCMYYYAYEDKVKYLLGDFYLDFDANIETEEDFKILKDNFLEVYSSILGDFKIKEESLLIYFSGNKGFHLVIPFMNLGYIAQAKLNEEYKNLALHYKKISPFVDTKIYDDRRLFRIPNTINDKSGFYKVPLTIEQVNRFSLEEMCRYANSPKKNIIPVYINGNCGEYNYDKAKAIVKQINKETKQVIDSYKRNYTSTYTDSESLPPCIEEMLNTVHYEGNRNQILVMLASSLFQYGCESQDVLSYLLTWAETHFDPMPNITEMTRTIQSAQSELSMGRRYGCTSAISLGFCNGTCRYISRKHDDDLWANL